MKTVTLTCWWCDMKVTRSTAHDHHHLVRAISRNVIETRQWQYSLPTTWCIARVRPALMCNYCCFRANEAPSLQGWEDGWPLRRIPRHNMANRKKTYFCISHTLAGCNGRSGRRGPFKTHCVGNFIYAHGGRCDSSWMAFTRFICLGSRHIGHSPPQ